MPDIRIERLDPCAPGVAAIIAASDAFYDGLYPAESNHLQDIDDLRKPNVVLVGVRCDDELVACGAARLMRDDSEYAEIKRVFVLESYRGRGLARQLMEFLQTELQGRGVGLLRLETGVRQPEALALYRRLGYVERGPFGAYRPDPLSVFMEKKVVKAHA